MSAPKAAETQARTDAQLLASYGVRDSHQAFAQLVRRYSPLVYGTCLRVLGEEHAAEDATQAAFMVLARKAGSLTGDVVLGDWLFRTARNCAMNLATARKRRARHEREAAMQASRRSKGESDPLWARVSPMLDAALAALPARQRQVASLYYCCGMNQAEIARETGVTPRAVSRRIAEALRGLRARLARAGVTVPAAALGKLLLERAVVPVPSALVDSVVAGCLGASAVSAAVSGTTRSVMRAMAWGRLQVAVLAALTVTALGLAAATAEGPPPAPAPAAGGQPVVVLDQETQFRTYLVYRTPVVATAEGTVRTALEPEWNQKKQKEPDPLPQIQSPMPPEDWREATFDDIIWPRAVAPVEVEPASATGRRKSARHSATRSSIVCLRGKFHVDDPGRVRDLKLSFEYVGGAAIYVNGTEIRRGHLPEGELKPDTLAEKYPEDLYCLPGGAFIQRERLEKRVGKFVKDEAELKSNQANFDRRYRSVADLAIDKKLLRKGENVLAIQIHRAPVNEAACKAEITPIGGMTRVQGIWAYAGLKSLRLSAGPGSTVRPNKGRPSGIQVWNCLPFDTITSSSWGDTGDALKPIRVPAARNGVFSGRLVVSSGAPLKGLKVTVSDLRAEKGEGLISASQIRTRCARPADPEKCWVPIGRYDALLEEIPAEIPVVEAQLVHRGPTVPTGAVAPLWITVRVPADAAPGTYRGKVGVEAQGLTPVEVPLELLVSGWKLPDPAGFRVHNLADLSPENLAMHYDVPFWSDRHFQLIGRSMKLMHDVGNRQVEVNLALDYHGVPGNSQTIVRWIRQPDGSYKHDFSVLEKLLDAVAENIGTPRPLRLNCWGSVQKGKLQSEWAKHVSLLDPATGKLERLEQPFPGSAESVAFWKPVIDGVRERVRERGWEELTSMGHQAYCWLPTPEMVDACHQIWPEAVWSFTAHNGTLSSTWNGTNGVKMPVRYSECVWTQGRISPRGYQRLLQRKDKKAIWNSVARNWHRDWSPIVRLRHLPEDMIMRGHDGVGQLGVDLFPLKSGRGGRHYHLNRGRGGLGPECSTRSLLAPGTDGPVVTERYEMFREGVQLCEAILFLQGALEETKIDGDLAAKVNALLDERGTAYINDWWESQFTRDEELFALAGEVAAKLAGK